VETYTVLKDCLGHAAGAEVQYEPDDVKHLLDAGKIVRKSAESKADADASLDGFVGATADAIYTAVVSKFNTEAAAKGGRLNLTVPDRSAAEAKDHGTLDEYLWCLAGQAQSFDPTRAQHSKNLLINKYSCKINPKFGEEYSATVQKGAGGLGAAAGESVSKASVQVESVGALGGFTVPPQFASEFFRLAGDQSLFLNRVKKYTMTGKQLMIPALDYSLGAAGTSPYLGGMNATWTSENVGFAQQNATMRQIELNANLLAGYTQASRTLLADSQVALAQVMTDLFAKAIAFNVDYAIFTGDGKNKPQGMINSGACKTFQRGTWSSNGVLLTDLSKADSYIIPELEGGAIWVVPPSFKQNLYPMTDASGKVVFLPNGAPGPAGASAYRPTMAVFGKDLFFSQLPATAASSGSVNLVIPSLYAFGLREEIEIGVSEHFAWTTNLLTWRFLFRGDGQSLLNTYLTLQNTDVVAPFVSITT
jgi:HK97 family phage major capsid protein